VVTLDNIQHINYEPRTLSSDKNHQFVRNIWIIYSCKSHCSL